MTSRPPLPAPRPAEVGHFPLPDVARGRTERGSGRRGAKIVRLSDGSMKQRRVAGADGMTIEEVVIKAFSMSMPM
jgi:hypothetical protein